jgi:SAM-dependent methyltransferase
MAEWFDDDSFWTAFEGYMFSRERVAAAPAEVDGMIAMLKIAPKARVLDLCCGPGRHCVEFARRGYAVTGVDRTRAYLEQARAAAARENLACEFVESDMRAFSRAATFDAAINFFTAFGYFDDPADDLKVARNLCDSLKPGGRMLVDVNGKENLARKFSERGWNRLQDGTLVLEERELLDGWRRIKTRWILISGTERRESTHVLRLYSGSELAALLERAGFSQVALYGSLKATPYDQNAQRLIAVAVK